jgi:hypothetical protein
MNRFSLFAFLLVFLNSCGNLFNENLIIRMDKKRLKKNVRRGIPKILKIINSHMNFSTMLVQLVL